MSPVPFYGVSDIAEALGVDPDLVAQWRKRGHLPPPDGEPRMGPVWAAATIEPWIAAKNAALRKEAKG